MVGEPALSPEFNTALLTGIRLVPLGRGDTPNYVRGEQQHG